MRRAGWFWLSAGLVLGALFLGALASVPAVPGRGAETASTGADALPPTAVVERRAISSRTQVEGTLTYAGDYAVVNHQAGYLTWLPDADATIAPGEVLYRVGALPVLLLPGSIPPWRDLAPGTSGSDAEQLNRGLAALGLLDLGRLDSAATFGPTTEEAVRTLQRTRGANPTGSLLLGSAVFFPASLRVAAVSAVLGARADVNSVVIRATSTSRRVRTAVSASQLKRIHTGDAVTITLNYGGSDQREMTGRVSRLSTSAKAGSAGSDLPRFEVEAVPDSPVPGEIDQMPVLVGFTDASARDALVVPVPALLSTPQGSMVERLGAEGRRALVPVRLGVFSEAEGVVQVIGEGLQAGDRVVVPAL